MIELFGSAYMPTIETERLVLRKLTMRDAADIFAYSRDPEVARHVLWDAHRTIGESKSYIRFMQRKYRACEPASWGIEWKQTGTVIGTIGYMWIQNDNACAEVGYSLSRPFWNRGIMTEALRAVLYHAFNDLRLNRVEAIHEVKNPASGAVMRKCGMRHEGLLREKVYNKGRYVDVEMYAILRDEFEDI
ncbi:MAG: GNAT family N-acetyltransferase [Clostridiales bacterium]|nr:GNAT family N-acetyltransferase [Clostridiales bacterium]